MEEGCLKYPSMSNSHEPSPHRTSEKIDEHHVVLIRLCIHVSPPHPPTLYPHSNSPTMYPGLLISVGVIVLLVFNVAFLIQVSRINESVTSLSTSLAPTRYVVDTSCDPVSTDVCRFGASLTFDETTACQVFNRPEGASCVDQCHIPTAATTCTQHQQCVSDTPGDCLGDCDASEDPDYPMFTIADPLCNASKLKYRDYFWLNWTDTYEFETIPGVSTTEFLAYVIPPYASRDGDCAAIGGCTWYVTHMTLSTQNNTLRTFLNKPGFACDDLIEANNTECLTTTRIPMGTDMATSLFRKLLFQFGNTTFYDSFFFEAEVCMWQYACAYSNTTMYEDPQFRVEAKRSLLGTPSTLRDLHLNRAYDRIMEDLGIHQERLAVALEHHNGVFVKFGR
jgi:hypothetical protein